MKRLFIRSYILLTLFWGSSLQVLSAQEVIQGRVELEPDCQDQAMVWLSHKTQEEQEKGDELLLHTLVPDKGSYAFSVKPGLYDVWASSPQGCEAQFQEVKVERGQNFELNIRLKK